jgi:hypothetical protein
MSFRGVIKYINIIAKQYLFIGILLSGVLYSQDPPPEFEFNISIYQSFYFFINSDIDGVPLLEGEDWIAAFSEYDETMGGLCVNIGDEVDGDEFTDDCQDVNEDGILSPSVDVCVGSFDWSGEYTTVPVMGNDGTQWTVGYMQEGQLPKFKIYDGSEDMIYIAVPSVVYPWSTDLAFYVVNITVIRDCHGDLAGDAFIDNCDICVEGNTGLEENYLDIGCGCSIPLIGPFYEDEDGDGLGYGEEEYFCENPGIGWSENNNDPYPSCVDNYFDCNNNCGGNAIIDDCDICSGGDTGLIPNSEIDCNNECFGIAYYDECDQCVGGSTGLGPCDFESDQPDEFSFYQSTLQAFYYIITASLNNGDYLSNQDWVAIFNGDICVGSIKWDGSFTTIPSMGDDGSEWTEGYLNAGDFPTFKMYDASIEEFYDVEMDVIIELSGTDEIPYTGWGINDFYYVYGFVGQSPDCYGVIGGDAIIDDCGVCSGGSTGLIPNGVVDCAGVCYGEAVIDNCGVCAAGTTDNIPNADDLGCGCFLDGPSDYFADIDNDGFGYGDVQSFCEDPGEGWTLNGDDPEPFCFNADISDLNVDDCGICNGGNEDLDCLGICFGSADLDECGECNGDNSSCQSPIANSLNVTTNEDEELLIQLTGSDPNGSELSFIINQSPEHGALTGNPDDLSQFNYTPNNNFYGEDSFTFVVFNGQFYSDEAALAVIQVNPINDAPEVEHITLEGQEDTNLIVTLIGEDVEEDGLTYSVINDPLNGSFSLTDNILTYSPNSDFYGEEQISYIANDGELNSEEALITIIVTAVNDQPVAQDIEITLYEDNVYSFTFDVADVDNSDDQISIYIQDEIEFGILSISGFEGTLLPHDDLFGDFSLSYQALDGELFSAPATLTVHILPVNDAPVLSTILDQSINEDEIFYYFLSASDIDDNQLDFSVEEVEYADVSIDSQTLLVSPEDDFNGLLLIEVSVTDGEFTDIKNFILNVIPVNDSPVLSSIEDQSSLEDQTFTMDIVANDVDGDILSYWSNVSQYADVSFTDNQLLVIPQNDWFGEINITVNVTDGEYIDSDEFVLDILPVNDAPILSTIDEQIIDEDFSLIYQIIASDIDGDNLDYQVEDISNAVSYTQEDTLFIIPNQDYNGLIEVMVSVSDEEFSITTAFNLIILPINDSPILDEISDQSIEENQISEVEFSAYDVDNDPLIYDYYISSGYGYVEIEDEILIVTPNQNWFGDLIVNFIVSDGEYYVQQEFEVEVIEIDDPPVAFDISSTTSEDQSLSINLISSDPDTDSSELIYSIFTEPEHGDVTISGVVVEYIPESDYNGSDQFLFNVNDGTTLSDPATVSIDVVPINDPPTAENVEYTLSSEALEFDLNLSIDDIDGDNLEINFITQNYGSATITTLFDGEIEDLGNNVFSYTPPLGMVYFDFILYKATDGFLESNVQTITFNLFGREMPRDMAPIAFDQDVSATEDQVAEVTLIGFDVLNAFSDDATFEITSEPVHGELSSIFTLLESGTNNLVQWSIEYTPDLNYFGEDSFSYKVINPDNSIPESEDGTIYISISPQNDAPQVFSTIFDQTLVEDSNGSQLSLDLFFIDVDNDPLEYEILSTNNEVVDISVDNNILFIVPYEDQNSDPFSVSLTASDGELEVSQSFHIEVLSVNDPPVANSSNQTFDEDNSVVIVLSGEDLEYDPLSFIIYQYPENGEISLDVNLVTYEPHENYNGTDSFGFKTNDGEYNSDLAIVSLTINPINDAPILDDIENQSINEDDTYEFNISGSDVDQNELSYTAIIQDEVESYEVSGNTLTVIPLQNMNGEIEIYVEVSDGALTDSKTFTLNIIPQPDAPELLEISNQEINEDENFIIFLSATDVDGDELSFYGLSDINGTIITIEDNLMIVDSPQDYYGNMIVTAGVTDNIYNVENNFTITFIPQPDAPVIEPIADQDVLEAIELIVDVSASDPDGDELTLSVDISNDINVTINELQIILQGQNNINGEFEVIVTVTDGTLSDQESFILNIINVNDPPTTYSQSLTLDEDNSSVIILVGDDPDLDPLEFFIDTYPEFGSISLLNGIATYSPASNFNGQDSFTFYAFDGEVSSNISTISLEVLPINDGPIIISQPDLVATEDILYSYQVIANDPEDDELSYELDTYPDGMQIDDSGLITWTPIEGQLTSREIVLVVFDGGEDGVLPFTQTFTIIVEPVNDRPEITSTAPTIAYEDEQYTYQVEVSDPDSDVFYYYLLIGPEGLVLDNFGLITWTPSEGVTSSGTVAFVVWDVLVPNPTIDLPAIQEFIVDVIPVNDPPEIVSVPLSNAIEDTEYIYQVEVVDIDNDVFYFTLIEAPEGMGINQNTGLLSWTPEEGILTSGNVSIIASDGLDEGMLYDIQNFAISVTPVNDAPIIISTAPTEAVQGQEYIYEILVDDPDDSEFTYILFNSPSEMEINFQMGILSWIPENGGVYGPITLKVQDGGEDFVVPATEIFYINVQYTSGPTTLVIPLHDNQNLISFSAIPEDNSIENILTDLGQYVLAIIGEGIASTYNENLGWLGSVDTIEPSKGYWIKAPDDDVIGDSIIYYQIEDAIPISNNYEYAIHEDANLISYLGIDGVSITDALPDELEQHMHSIVGEGVAAMQTENGWIGSLDAFERNKGYWLKNIITDVDTILYFSWVIPDEELLFSDGFIKEVKRSETLNDFKYNQSSKQAFYFIDKINLDDIALTPDDWIIAYNNNIIVGARKWNGRYTDIPAMGYDGYSSTLGYCEDADIPDFKIYIDKTGEILDLVPSNVEPWNDLSTTIIGQLNQVAPIPESFEFSYPYPNPFNPSTLIKFSLPNDTKVKIMAYDVTGRHVDTILNRRLDAGYYDLTWKPTMLSSGIYLLNIQTNESDLTHKVMFIK